jgi:dephospho-CoA kinase
MRVGLTGAVGSGKSRVLSILARRGVPTLQTDRVGHELLSDSKVIRALKRSFGRRVFSSGGKVDRRVLGHLVFKDPRKRAELNGLLHPLVRARVSDWFERQSHKKPQPMIVVVEVPLLFERGYSKWFDTTVSVSADSRTRGKRLARRGWDPTEVHLRERTQWSQKRKDRSADWIIRNGGSLRQLSSSIDEWLQNVRKKAAARRWGSGVKNRKRLPT